MNPNYSENVVCTKEDLIGQGAFGKVYRARDQNNNVYALKEITCRNDTDLDAVFEEIRVLGQTNNQNINVLHDVKLGETKPFEATFSLILEFCSGGNLNERLASPSSERKNLEWMSQIINGVEYLHNKNIIHRDIKPQNILLTCQEQVKISDFGLATKFCDKTQQQTLLSYYFDLGCGASCYVAPELLRTPVHYNYKVDIYGMGVIFYAIMERTFLNVDNQDCYGVYVTDKQQPLGVVMHNVENDVKISFKRNFPFLRSKNKALKKLIKNMLKYDYHERKEIQVIKDKFTNFSK